MPSENGRRAIAIRMDPIWTTVMPRFSTSMKPSGSRLARSRISCAMARSSYSLVGASRIFTSFMSVMVPFFAVGLTRSLRYTAMVCSSKNWSIPSGTKSVTCGFK